MEIRMINSYKDYFDISMLTAFETRLGIKLPSTYRGFLQDYNGGIPHETNQFFTFIDDDLRKEAMVQDFFGFHDIGYSNLNTFSKWIGVRVPHELLPIAMDPGGNLICLGIRDDVLNKVFFWDHDWEYEEGETPGYRNVYPVADTFREFVAMLS